MSDLELHDVLAEKLTDREMQALERQIRRIVEQATEKAVEITASEAYKRHWAISMRVLRDRFGWGAGRIRRLWDACLEYLADIDSGLISADEMFRTLEREDGIVITWNMPKEENK